MGNRLGPALALAFLFALAAFGLGHQMRGYQPEPHYERQLAKAESGDAVLGQSPAPAAESYGAGKGAEKSYWETIFLEHITDWILAVFTGLLVLYTRRLYVETGGLKDSTDKLWAAGERQIAVAKESADAATRAAAVADATLVAAQRPWIKIEQIGIGDHLVFEPTPDDHEGCIGLTIVVKNTGNSPAVRVAVETRLVGSNRAGLLDQQALFASAVRNMRVQAENSPNTVKPEITLFPGDKHTFHVHAWMNADPLADYRKWAGGIPGAIVRLAIIGVVFYEFTFAKGHHQSGIIYGLRRVHPYPTNFRPAYSSIAYNFPVTSVPGAFHLEGTTNAGMIDIQPVFEGTGAID